MLLSYLSFLINFPQFWQISLVCTRRTEKEKQEGLSSQTQALLLKGQSAFLLPKAASRSAHDNSEVKTLSVMRSQAFQKFTQLWVQCRRIPLFPLVLLHAHLEAAKPGMKRFKGNTSSSWLLICAFRRVLGWKLWSC